MPSHTTTTPYRPPWLGQPALAELMPHAGVDAQLARGVRAAGMALRLLGNGGECLAQAGELAGCPDCPAHAASPCAEARPSCPHGWSTLQVPVMLEGLRAGSLLMGPFEAAATGEARARPSLSAIAELAADAVSAELRSCMLSRTPGGSPRDKARLHEADKLAAMARLAGGIAHDFNNQLTVVIGNAALLRKGLRDAMEVNFVDNVVAAASHCAELTRKMLAFARTDRAQGSHLDVHALIAEVSARLEPLAGLRIEMQLQASPFLVPGDRPALASALLNLALNARDAMPAGGTLTFATRTLWIDGSSAAAPWHGCAPGPYVEISVSDTGPGMSDDVVSQLFEPFFTTKPVGQGTGLGLSAAYGTVRSHGGAIQVDTQLGAGSTFRVCLPYEGHDAHVSATPDSSGERALAPAGLAQRVLVVDDEPLVRQALSALIQAFGYAVECCADGPAAIACLDSHPDIGLVILDLVLPGMDGTAIFRAMRARRPELKLLVSSGYADSDQCRALIAEGATGALAKPFRADELSRTLEQLLGAPNP